MGDEMQAIFKLSKLLDFDGIRRLRANSNNNIFCRNTQNIPDEIHINWLIYIIINECSKMGYNKKLKKDYKELMCLDKL